MSVTVRDEARELRFEGELLAEASSERPDKDRWIEFKIYRTADRNYVVPRIGRTRRASEIDRFSAHVSETAQGVLETLYMYDEDGVRYLTKIARELLANVTDPELSAAYRTETIK